MMVMDDENLEQGMKMVTGISISDMVKRLVALGKSALCAGNIPFDIPWYLSAALPIAQGLAGC